MTALVEAFERFAPMVHSIAFSILKDTQEAEDLTQDVFGQKLPALMVEKPGLSRSETGAWLARVARNRAIDIYRRKRRFPHLEMGSAAAPEPAAPDGSAEEELHDLLGRLEPRHKEVMTLKYLWCLTWEEVGEKLKLSPQGARKRASLAMEAARKLAPREKEET